MEKEQAGLSNRFNAYLIDILIFISILFLISTKFSSLEILSNYIKHPEDINARIDFLRMRNIIRDISFILYIIYSIVMDVSPIQGTVGKRIVKIKVINKDGSRLSLKESMTRNLFKMVSMIPFCLGHLWILFSRNKRSWHDSVAKTDIVMR